MSIIEKPYIAKDANLIKVKVVTLIENSCGNLREEEIKHPDYPRYLDGDEQSYTFLVNYYDVTTVENVTRLIPDWVRNRLFCDLKKYDVIISVLVKEIVIEGSVNFPIKEEIDGILYED